MTHGCSPFAETRRRLTPLDIVTAHTVLPGRDAIALLLEEAMRSQGWMGGRMEEKRRALDEKLKRKSRQKSVRENVSKVLGLQNQWWPSYEEDDSSLSDDSDGDDDGHDEALYVSRISSLKIGLQLPYLVTETPPLDFTSMLAWSPQELSHIFDSVIRTSHTSVRNSQPAITLYLMARFACLTCDQTWLEDLILGATDAIEEKFFNRSEDITCLIFCLYNATIWLHLMQCDNSINEGCEMLGSFELLEQVINSVFVFIIRFAERRIDQLLDAALLDSSPLSSELDSVQFESEWSFLRPFTAKKKNTANTPNPKQLKNNTPASPPFLPSRPPSPSPLLHSLAPVTAKGPSSLRQTLSRAKAPSTSAYAVFPDISQGLRDLTSFLTALHTLFTLSDVNPVLIIQFWSQVMYWTSCEIFNRVLTRKKYLCRSKAVQIGMNLIVLEEWVDDMGLPRGIVSHLTPVRDLLNWLQCLSSITDFSNLVATIQTMKSLNAPTQMRRAVRDYKYEVNEGRMTDECIQYLTQLQKDWERHRVKIGVDALRKEMDERERERELEDGMASEANAPSINASLETSAAQNSIDMLFDRSRSQSEWESAKPLQVLGELLDSRHMLPLFLPSDPRMLSATPAKQAVTGFGDQENTRPFTNTRSSSRTSTVDGGAMKWRCRSRSVRNVKFETLRWVDRFRTKPQTLPLRVLEEEYEENPSTPLSDDVGDLRINTDVPFAVSHGTPLTKRPSARSRGRLSLIGEPVVATSL
ncbi:hypothetical protein AZE42_00123 [Rhizopogon vesiculosus]|uniref:Dilute domain-containing protein n=1 Tax=Rhizopogon vesiculosus TaxID=180088 RepID=A0A1J8Q8H0_9AGAM|nr:hypothetical protein AZE42_00123 [Rhizopogon vesiculosus]